MKTFTILAMFAILAGTTLLAITGFTSTLAQTTMDNATLAGNMTGNMTGDNMTGDNATGTISGKQGRR